MISTKEDVISYINNCSEEDLQVLYKYVNNYQKNKDKIYSDLAESRACYERGEYEDFDTALYDISKKYGL